MRHVANCRHCNWHECDLLGHHALNCPGSGSTTLHHDTIVNRLLRSVVDIGMHAGTEHDGGLKDTGTGKGQRRRPGDLIIYNWDGGRYALIDVAVVNAFTASHSKEIDKGGSGAAASAYEAYKRRKYPEYRQVPHLRDQFIFLPFVMETTGGLGKTARYVLQELRQRRETKNCSSFTPTTKREARDPLLLALSMDLVRQNAAMVIEREPLPESFTTDRFVHCEMKAEKWKESAREELRVRRLY